MENLSGQEIKGYVLRELIGVGGFAAVYRAFQPAVEREVAVKIILPQYANNPDFVRRFETEAQLIARLEHIHIVPLFDYWREPHNAYLVMRWLRGGNLFHDIQQHGAWQPVRAARLLDQIASALTVAHRQGVIHQDITPTNILLDTEKNAYLADFGIARNVLSPEAAGPVSGVFGSPAYIAPERIQLKPVTPRTDIYSLGLVLYEVLTGVAPFDGPTYTSLISQQLVDPVPPLQLHNPELPSTFNAVLMIATSKRPEQRFASVAAMAAQFRRAVETHEHAADTATDMAQGDWPPRSVPRPGRDISTVPLDGPLPSETVSLLTPFAPVNPYKGLRAFDEPDAADFYGRTDQVEKLLRRLADPEMHRRLLVITGASGSGKSSVVRAGLLPALRQGIFPGSENWFIAKMIPGSHPLEELETALLSIAVDEVPDLGARLRSSPRGLHEVVQDIAPSDEIDLVLLIDQFEELFALVDDEAEREQFLRLLFHAVTEPGSRLWCLVTLRIDYYDRPLLHPQLGPIFRDRTEIVYPLSASQLQEAISGPASRVGLELEEGLAAEIVNDLAAQPGALPLLQYALTELYEHRDENRLLLSAYRERGGVSGTLARRADETFSALPAEQQQLARQVFLRLVNLGEGSEDTRRRVGWSELTAISRDGKTELQAILDAFGRHRLLTFDRDPQTREPTAEIAHEALIRQWSQLQTWLDDDRENLRIQRRLSAATREWNSAQRNRSFLAAGVRLAQFESLAKSATLTLSVDEQAYLEASIAQRQRGRQRARLFITLLTLLTILASGLAVFALDRERRAENARSAAVTQRERADTQAALSRSRELAITALTNIEQLDLSLLLGLEALAAAETAEARSSLLTALQSGPFLSAYLHGHQAPVRKVAFSPDGARLASTSRDGVIIIWDTNTRRPTRQPITLEDGWSTGLAFSPDGSLLATGTSSGDILLWDSATRQSRGDPLVGHVDDVWDVAFSPDGLTLASASTDGTVRLWDLATGQPIGDPLADHADYVFAVAFSPDGDLLASAGADNAIRLWDAATGQPAGDPLEGHTDWVYSLSFSPDGDLLASGAGDTTVRLWDVATGQPAAEPFRTHTQEVRGVDFSPDGSLLVSAGADGIVLLWDPAAGTLAAPPLVQHADAVWCAAFAPDGRFLASAGADAQVLLWDRQAAVPLQRARLSGHQEPVLAVAYSPDGRIIASASGAPNGGGFENTVRLWDAATGKDLGTLGPHADSVTAIAFSPDGQMLAAVSADRMLTLWDVVAQEDVYSVPSRDNLSALISVSFSPDGQTIASGGDDGIIVLWDAATGEPVTDPLVGPADSVFALAFNSHGDILAAGNRDGTITLWNPTTRQPVADPLQGHTDAVTSLAFRPDGTNLVSGSRDGTLILWDVSTRQPLGAPLTGHSQWVTGVDFSEDGQWIVSSSRDGTVILWDTSTRRMVGQPFAGHADWVSGVAFSPDGETVASASWDRTLILWDTSLASWRESACRIANRGFTAEETARFFQTQPPPLPCEELVAPVPP